MSELIENHSLKNHNTFGFDVKSKYFFSFEDELDLYDLLENNSFTANDVLVIGEGSNILFVEDYEGLIICPQNKSIEVLKEEEDKVYVRVGAGYVWDEFVDYAVAKGWGGLENLSGIPGTIGACPVQNIGAYGVEVADCIHSVDVVNIETVEQRIFEKDQCDFGYRDSIFKNKYKNLFVITHVVFELNIDHKPIITYGHLKSEVDSIGELTIENVRKAVISIRDSKLPSPEQLGNAGSFFKNPVVSAETLNNLKSKYDDMPYYLLESGDVKLAAGWLIDKCGLKGFRKGNVGIHDKQALVLVNYGGATGLEIVQLANLVKNKVFAEFRIMLEQEVKVI